MKPANFSTADLAAELHRRGHHVLTLRYHAMPSEDGGCHSDPYRGRLDTDPVPLPDGYELVDGCRRYAEEYGPR